MEYLFTSQTSERSVTVIIRQKDCLNTKILTIYHHNAKPQQSRRLLYLTVYRINSSCQSMSMAATPLTQEVQCLNSVSNLPGFRM